MRYSRAHVAHASIGPSCALALFDAGRLTVWSHSQGIFPLRAQIAACLGLEPSAVRVVHASGMVDVIQDLRFSAGAGAAGREALRKGAPIIADCRMVAEGVTRARLPADNKVICTLQDARVPARAKEIGNTRSAAALDFWHAHLKGSVVAIGNAPTALFRLLELLDAGAPKPALILGFPVGFVGAAESKEALAESKLGIPYAIVRGRMGGSAMTAAAVNALARPGL